MACYPCPCRACGSEVGAFHLPLTSWLMPPQYLLITGRKIEVCLTPLTFSLFMICSFLSSFITHFLLHLQAPLRLCSHKERKCPSCLPSNPLPPRFNEPQDSPFSFCHSPFQCLFLLLFFFSSSFFLFIPCCQGAVRFVG